MCCDRRSCVLVTLEIADNFYSGIQMSSSFPSPTLHYGFSLILKECWEDSEKTDCLHSMVNHNSAT